MKVAQYYKWNLDELKLADRLGYDGIGVNEHHQNVYGFMASPNLMAAAVARRTPNNSAILVLGNTLALYQPALRVAEEFAMLDCLTDGLARRLVSGRHVDGRRRCYGITPTETRPRFYEAHDLIMKAWTQPGPFPYRGRFNKLRYVNPWPQPLQKPHPPGVAGRRRLGRDLRDGRQLRLHLQLPQLLRLPVAKQGDGDVLGDRLDRLGADQNPYRAGFAQWILRLRDRRQGRGGLPRARHLLLQEVPPHPQPYYMETPGYRTRRSTEFVLKSGQPADVDAALTAEKDWKNLVDMGFIIAGSPETVADRLIEACRGRRVGNLVPAL